MKTSISVTLLALGAAVAAYPAGTGVSRRNCVPGALVCNGKEMFALCNLDYQTTWMHVAEGTNCICDGADCIIADVTGDDHPPMDTASHQAPGPSVPSSTLSTTQPDAPQKTVPSVPEMKPVAKPVVKPETKAEIKPEAKPETKPETTPKPVLFRPNRPQPQPSPPSSSPTPSSTTSSSSIAPGPTGSDSAGPDSGSGSGSGKASAPGKAYIKTFSGTGDHSQGWPSKSEWVDFESMWSNNLDDTIRKSCASFQQENNSDQESAAVKKAIQSVSQSSGIDSRFILAVLMQESGGCVRAPTTNYGVTNPGLMQSHNGDHSCFNVKPCPEEKILGMVKDGALGTSSGDGLQQLLAKAGQDDSKFYKAARMYNSGSIASSGILQDGIATHCYASDIANRLLGWSAGLGTCNYK
ncbi:hypothetical protein E4U32_007426 [Claviceps aff. humidiphila group G2b]|nr:hypothetical protein E4U32_007426 [Claviceps aff. humidiphila group G2b]